MKRIRKTTISSRSTAWRDSTATICVVHIHFTCIMVHVRPSSRHSYGYDCWVSPLLWPFIALLQLTEIRELSIISSALRHHIYTWNVRDIPTLTYIHDYNSVCPYLLVNTKNLLNFWSPSWNKTSDAMRLSLSLSSSLERDSQRQNI